MEALKNKLKSQGVKYCVGAYVDIHGVPKGKFVPIDHFEHFAADPVVEKALGSELPAEFIKYKSEEWRQYHQTVRQWEIDKYATLY